MIEETPHPAVLEERRLDKRTRLTWSRWNWGTEEAPYYTHVVRIERKIADIRLAVDQAVAEWEMDSSRLDLKEETEQRALNMLDQASERYLPPTLRIGALFRRRNTPNSPVWQVLEKWQQDEVWWYRMQRMERKDGRWWPLPWPSEVRINCEEEAEILIEVRAPYRRPDW